MPLLSWVNANARYGADYTWLAGPVFPDSLKINMGNSIKNHNELTLTGMANLATLYNKSKFLKNIDNSTRPDAAKRMQPNLETVTYTKENVDFRAKSVKSIVHNLRTKDIKVRVIGKDGKEVKGRTDIINENRINFTAEEKADGAKVVVEGKVRPKKNPGVVAAEYLLRFIMGIRSVSLTLNSSQGQFLPGYTPGTNFLGMTNYGSNLAPGWPFILGFGDENFFDRAVSRGWISTDTLLNTPANQYRNRDLSFRSLIEPVPGLRIGDT